MELGEHDLDAGELGLGLNVDGDAATVICDLCGAIGVQGDDDRGAMAAQGLIYSVIDDLPEAVHEATAVIGADIHAWPLAYGL